MQKVTPTGSGVERQEEGEGRDDYSTWTCTYSEDYHLITEGVNELTSKISCENSIFCIVDGLLSFRTLGSIMAIFNTSILD
jgi:hypothetical protein